MIELILQLIAMSLSGLILIPIFMKYGWSKRAWSILNKKIQPKYNSVLWISFVICFNTFIHDLIKLMEIPFSNIIMGIMFGICFSFLPNLNDKMM